VAIALTYPYQVVRARIQVSSVHTSHQRYTPDNSTTLEQINIPHLPRHPNNNPDHPPPGRDTSILQRSGHQRVTDITRDVHDVCRVRELGVGIQADSREEGGQGGGGGGSGGVKGRERCKDYTTIYDY
jgi:hypothetical protein